MVIHSKSQHQDNKYRDVNFIHIRHLRWFLGMAQLSKRPIHRHLGRVGGLETQSGVQLEIQFCKLQTELKPKLQL